MQTHQKNPSALADSGGVVLLVVMPFGNLTNCQLTNMAIRFPDPSFGSWIDGSTSNGITQEWRFALNSTTEDNCYWNKRKKLS